MENLLGVLQLHKQQKQHLLIKRAILLKFEEQMFGNNNITMTIDLRCVSFFIFLTVLATVLLLVSLQLKQQLQVVDEELLEKS